MKKIYVASSWRNEQQANVVQALKSAGHDVYDFRNPSPGDMGFHWSEIDPNWKNWTPEEFAERLEHPIARAGYAKDMAALGACDVCVLVMPCGRSAHLEAGWAAGAGKRLMILLSDGEPELMYRMAEVYADLGNIVTTLAFRSCSVCGRPLLPVQVAVDIKVDDGVLYPDNLWALEGLCGKLTKAWACRHTCQEAEPIEDSPAAAAEWNKEHLAATVSLADRPLRTPEKADQ